MSPVRSRIVLLPCASHRRRRACRKIAPSADAILPFASLAKECCDAPSGLTLAYRNRPVDRNCSQVKRHGPRGPPSPARQRPCVNVPHRRPANRDARNPGALDVPERSDRTARRAAGYYCAVGVTNRNVRLTRSPCTAGAFGTRCSHSACVRPRITSRLPCVSRYACVTPLAR